MNQSLEDIIRDIQLPIDHFDRQDSETIEVFLEETREIIEYWGVILPKWIKEPENESYIVEIRRTFHILKGSGRMAGALQSAELAMAIEELLNTVIKGGLKLEKRMQALTCSVARLYQQIILDFEHKQAHQIDFRYWIAAAHCLREKSPLPKALKFTLKYYDSSSSENDLQLELEDTEPSQPSRGENTESTGLESTISIFIEESHEHLSKIAEFLKLNRNPSYEEFNQLLRALHTIRGSSGMVSEEAIFNASSHVEQMLKSIDPENWVELDVEKQLLADYHQYINSYVQLLKQQKHQEIIELNQQFQTKLDAYLLDVTTESSPLTSQGLVGKLIDSNINELLDAELNFVEQVEQHPDSYLQTLMAQSDLVMQYAKETKVDGLAHLAESLNGCYHALLKHPDAVNNLEILQAVQGVHVYLVNLFDALASAEVIKIDPQFNRAIAEITTQVEALAKAPSVDLDLSPDQCSGTTADHDPETVDAQHSDAIDEQGLSTAGSTPDQPVVDFGADPDIFNIFLDEASELIDEMDHVLSNWEQAPEDTVALQQMFRDLHTLKGGANMMHVYQLGTIAHELESIYEQIIQAKISVNANLMHWIRTAQDNLASRLQLLREQLIDPDASTLVEQLRASVAKCILLDNPALISSNTDADVAIVTGSHDQTDAELVHVEPEQADDLGAESEPLDIDHILAEVEQAQIREVDQHRVDSIEILVPVDAACDVHEDCDSYSFEDSDPEIVRVFLEEAIELLDELENTCLSWKKQSYSDAALEQMILHLQTLSIGANVVYARHLSEKLQALEQVYVTIQAYQLTIDTQLMSHLLQAQDDLQKHVQQLLHAKIDMSSTSFVLTMQSIVQQYQQHATAQQGFERDGWSSQDHTEATDSSSLPSVSGELLVADSDCDQDIAAEYLAEAERYFARWMNHRDDHGLLLHLQSTFYSLQQYALQQDQPQLSDIATQLETIFECFALHRYGLKSYDALLLEAQQWLRVALETQRYDGFELLSQQLSAVNVEDDWDNFNIDQVGEKQFNLDDLVGLRQSQQQSAVPPAMYAETLHSDNRPNTQEAIRVSANLVEKMIDLAGEHAVNRARMELDVGIISSTLNEMELAIIRLADQLRRMEGELETYIGSQHQIDVAQYAGFDLLEMDQYSALNQLSKSLAESASDLIDFKDTLADKIRGTENQLIQQSRINNELQQQLMSTRLVPFSRLVPRLQRLVREISSQLNRPVEFSIDNTDSLLDRNILDRLITPLEHMLRNAIDHGLEDQAQRQQLNKPEVGKIKLSIISEGHDLKLVLSDDGKGVDIQLVREKALQQGLIRANQVIRDQDMLQYIFHSGLSTAEKVTQISGRGVGLDVVQNEIKALGGDVSVQSYLGQGSSFSIRVPTTVTIVDALMVRVAEQQYALALAQIDRIILAAPRDLQDYYYSEQEKIQIDGQSYQLRYIGEFINNQRIPKLHHESQYIPLLVYQSAGQQIALQVDQLMGSSEKIVVKSVGRQLSSVPYLSGSTILADGRVCLIVDGASISRRVLTSSRLLDLSHYGMDQELKKSKRQTIMVVDDSVTVRKITTHLLERNGYDVISAKDGIDALEKLDTAKPDLMLLDIEMPRMDGFEVLNTVRHDEVYQQLPIIMITSRSGEKHRERAASLGVNQYLGKPYQEDILLQAIVELLGPNPLN